MHQAISTAILYQNLNPNSSLPPIFLTDLCTTLCGIVLEKKLITLHSFDNIKQVETVINTTSNNDTQGDGGQKDGGDSNKSSGSGGSAKKNKSDMSKKSSKDSGKKSNTGKTQTLGSGECMWEFTPFHKGFDFFGALEQAKSLDEEERLEYLQTVCAPNWTLPTFV